MCNILLQGGTFIENEQNERNYSGCKLFADVGEGSRPRRGGEVDFTNKEFLAIILKYMNAEFRDMTFQEIENCIEADSIRKAKEVALGRTNSNRIAGSHNEFAALLEILAVFDIYFKAVNPKLSNEKVTYCLHIDVERRRLLPRLSHRKEGHLLHGEDDRLSSDGTDDIHGLQCVGWRGVHDLDFKNRIPKAFQNTMSLYEIENTWSSRDVRLDQSANDLMTMAIIRLGDDPRVDMQEGGHTTLTMHSFP